MSDGKIVTVDGGMTPRFTHRGPKLDARGTMKHVLEDISFQSRSSLEFGRSSMQRALRPAPNAEPSGCAEGLELAAFTGGFDEDDFYRRHSCAHPVVCGVVRTLNSLQNQLARR